MDAVGTMLLLNSLILGFRHGIDWDHLAAIVDIVGATTFESRRRETLKFSLLYALGHASVLAVLGIAAIAFAAVLPSWLDGMMQRIVGLTLLFLGAWVLYSLCLFVSGKTTGYPRSRWMLIFGAIKGALQWLRGKLSGKATPPDFSIRQYGARTAFGVGMIHGIGAETGTQVLLLVAVAGAASQQIGFAMLFFFIIGLITSNSFVALLGISGFASSAAVRPLYLSISLLSALFGLAVGAVFASGNAAMLPSLCPP